MKNLIAFLLLATTALGADSVKTLCSRLTPPGSNDNSEVRLAIQTAVNSAKQPGAVAAELVAGLNAATDAEVQDFILEQLRFVATEREIPAATKFLLHERLSDRAIRVLVTVGGPAAERELLAALPKATGARADALMKALGDLGSTADIPNASNYVLIRSGTPRAGQLLKTRDQAAYLRYGERLLELNRPNEAAVVATDLLSASLPANRCCALALLTTIQGKSALPALLTALDDTNSSVREQAVRQLATLPVVPELVAAARADKAGALEALARHPDYKDAALFVANLQTNGDAAIEGLRRIGGATAVNAVWPVADKPEVRAALVAMRGADVDAEIAKKLPAVAALELLAQRRAHAQVPAVLPLATDADTKVATAACNALAVLAGPAELEQLVTKALATNEPAQRDRLTKPILSAAARLEDKERCVAKLVAAPATQREWMLFVLPAFGGKAALDTAVAAAGGADEKLRAAGVRSLGDWRDGTAVAPLLALARNGGDERVKILATRGAVSVIERAEMDKSEKQKMLEQLVEAAPRPEDKQFVQAALQRLTEKEKPKGKKKK